MLKQQTWRLPSPSGWFAPAAAQDRLSRFLIESEQRVLAHCRQMLVHPDLATDLRHRLTRLVAEAEVRMQDLAP